MVSPVQSTGISYSRLQSNPSALQTKLLFEMLHTSLRQFKTASVIIFCPTYKSDFTGLKTPFWAQVFNRCYLMLIGVILTFRRYWFISSDLSATESKKKYNCKNSKSSSALSIIDLCLLKIVPQRELGIFLLY